jgi:hypothetical protein
MLPGQRVSLKKQIENWIDTEIRRRAAMDVSQQGDEVEICFSSQRLGITLSRHHVVERGPSENSPGAGVDIPDIHPR